MDRYSIELPQLDVEKRTKMTFYLKFERKRRKKKAHKDQNNLDGRRNPVFTDGIFPFVTEVTAKKVQNPRWKSGAVWEFPGRWYCCQCFPATS